MMGRAWSCVGIGLALLGCTRPNLAYDGGEVDTDLGTQGSQSGSGLASTSVTTSSGDVADSADSSEGPKPSTTTGEMVDTDGGCVFDEPPLRYGIHRGDGSPLGCMDQFAEPNFGLRVNAADMMSLTGVACSGCPCNEPGMTISLNFDVPLPLITPGTMKDPVCVTITRALSDMGCDLLGYAVMAWDESGARPPQILAAASNELDPGDGVPFEADLLTPTENCMGTCPGGDDPADYVLELTSEGATAEVSPDAMAWLGEIDVYNDASYIAPNCTEVVRWYAVLP